MVTKAKKPSVKAVVGNSKKSKSSSGVTKRMALFGLVGIMSFSVIAGLGWQKWQDNQLKARAAGWTSIYTAIGATGGDGHEIYACKVGPKLARKQLTYIVKVYVYNPSTKTYTDNFVNYVNGALGNSLKFTTSPGSSSRIKSMTVGVNDSWDGGSSYLQGMGAGWGGPHSYDLITSC